MNQEHVPNGADPLPTAPPTTSLSPSSVNATGIQNSFARSDHSHAMTGFQISGNYITGLTGDVGATGPGLVSATVVTVGGSSASNIHTAELLANSATSSNIAGTIVQRDASGYFSISGITGGIIIGGEFSGSSGYFSGLLTVAGGISGSTGYFSELSFSSLTLSGTGTFNGGLTASTGYFNNMIAGVVTSSTGYFNTANISSTTGNTGYFNSLLLGQVSGNTGYFISIDINSATGNNSYFGTMNFTTLSGTNGWINVITGGTGYFNSVNIPSFTGANMYVGIITGGTGYFSTIVSTYTGANANFTNITGTNSWLSNITGTNLWMFNENIGTIQEELDFLFHFLEQMFMLLQFLVKRDIFFLLLVKCMRCQI